ncbi:MULTISPECIES: hypothetical protein [Achromobacter]|uniref:hypothetical protein n=1 Tax=Achromobacter TaxID=222 RepID=UPI0014687F3B|nr:MULTISPECIES: hypothetical protein [Achromobacter]MBD9432134.1 hypothetical protein [Achromobacter sp. ACM03]MBD9475698.1 hypothetical protein [Achromobacter sp. ACM01]MDQ1759193.1 hypothetical protein [Achromobacter aegrifaciens]CAB3666314.1 hypothetical protein LMG26852_03402 [Achromobacter aegrifaciens]CAB3823741.1 hypothetical protein LMG26854_01610 [Achromobacter aegrifaciens]
MSDFIDAWPSWAKWVWLGLLLSLAQAAYMLWRERQRRAAGRKEVQRQDGLRVSGLPGTARVTAARDTRRRIGDTLYFVIELDLDVAATSATPALSRTLSVPLSPLHLADFGVGKTIQVRVDPATREVVVDQATG